MSIDVTTSGPLFDGRAEAALERGVKDVRRKIADKGERIVRDTFAGSIRENHGVFESQFTILDSSAVMQYHKYSMPVAVGPEEVAVTTENAMYGPWLEGVGSRNETTRFKGYWGFRIAFGILDAIAGGLADAELAPYVEEMD